MNDSRKKSPPPPAGNRALNQTRVPQSAGDATIPPARSDGTSGVLAIGSEFGRYKVERLLGEGGMGAVYLARDQALERSVALKVPKFEASDSDGRTRFVREARTAAQLRHANVCPIHDVGEINGTPFLTMAFIEGRTLADWIDNRRLTQRQAALLTRKLAIALSEAHASGIIHRDLKPANIMIDRKSEPVVMDFGLARSYQSGSERVTQTGVVVGSPAYMSPEQVHGKVAELGPATDIYSLGIILYELLTGRLPFTGPLMAVIAAVLTETPPAPRSIQPEIDEALEAICLRMISRKPEDRFGSMKEVADALKGWLAARGSDPAMSGANLSGSEGRRAAAATIPQPLTAPAKKPATPPPLEPPPDEEFAELPPPRRRRVHDSITGVFHRTDRWFLGIAVAAGVAIAVVILALAGVSFRGALQNAGAQPGDPGAGGEGGQPAPARFNAARAGQAWSENGLKIDFRWCPDGAFEMGSPSGESGRGKDEDQVDVTLSGFWMGRTEVTQEQWEAVMGTRPWGNEQYVRNGNNYPATFVSWTEASEFCDRYTANERAARRLSEDWDYRLPTEAQWEYACRAGRGERYCFGDSRAELREYAWFDENANNVNEEYCHLVGLKKENAWGLCDVHGNAREWVRDWYRQRLFPGRDPEYTSGTSYRVSRSGSWMSPADSCRSSNRDWHAPASRYFALGFRMAIVRNDPAAPAGTPSPASTRPTAAANPPNPPADPPATKPSADPVAAQPSALTNSIGMKLVRVAPGEYLRGSPANDRDAEDDEKPQHRVRITRPFYLGAQEVTQSAWKSVMNTEPWKGKEYTRDGANYPATHVSWDDAQEFCRRLSRTESKRIRLPTEGEWEYACRAGSTTRFSFGDSTSQLITFAWLDQNTYYYGEKYAHAVGSKLPNDFGLYDMHGNVWEWCEDGYDVLQYSQFRGQQLVDPTGPSGKITHRIVRGGSWLNASVSCRSAFRYGHPPETRANTLGFRIAMDAE